LFGSDEEVTNMGNPRIRGLVFLAVGLVAAWFLCVFLPFTALPNTGLGVGMPVITVPGETIHYNWIGNFNLPNTLMGGWLASFLVLLWAGLAYRSTKGWTREIPDRWQAWTEFIVESFYNFCNGLGGENFRKAPLLWPFVAAIFFFLLAGNWGKLLPGFESVGYLHCGYENFSGYQRLGEGTSGRLWVDGALDAGVTQTAESEEACIHQMKVLNLYYGDFDPADYEEERVAFYARLAAINGDVPEEYAALIPDVTASTIALTSTLATEAPADDADDEFENEPATGDCLSYAADQEATAAELIGGEVGEAAEAAEDHGEEADDHSEEGDDHSEDAAAEDDAHGDEEGDHEEDAESSNDSASLLLTSTLATEEGDDDHGDEEGYSKYETVEPEVIAAAFQELIALESEHEDGLVTDLALENKQCEVTRMLHPEAIFPLTSDEMRENDIQPYIFTLAPWFRGVATDLSFNFGLAIMSILAVQIYGVIALGPAYFEKFINISALGNLGKKPMGMIDFIVGLIEIISEIGKIVSLAFRLFGNIFAGGVALLVVMFLVDNLIPGVIMLLEIVIGAVQALVFAVLTLVFSVQAMEHHGDDHDHDDHH
jgi:F0F1-type ATP synthase membrane subunit a